MSDHLLNTIGAQIEKLRMEHKISREALEEACGLKEQSIKKIERNPSKTFDVSALCAIADYFDVDVDYILGKQKEKRKTVADASNVTGLTYDAVSLLSTWNKSNNRRKNWSEFLSRIITDEKSETLFECISEIMGHAKIISKMNNDDLADKETYAASLWYITHTFSNIIERIFVKQLDNYLQQESEKGRE